MTEREQQQIDRINELSALARTSWLALLVYLAYIGITLLAVEDADFFVPSRQTGLPLVGIAIPTFSFFVFAPPLGAALYIYLHIQLLKLCDVLAMAPAHIDGDALGDCIDPWLANDLFLTMRADGAASSRPLRRLSNLASGLLVWVAAPLVLAGFWWRSMSVHEEWLTLFLALSLLIATYAGFSSWWSTCSAACRGFRRPWPMPWRGGWRRPAGLVAALVIIVLSWLRTEGGVDYYVNRAIDFAEVTLGRSLCPVGTYPNGDGESPQIVQEEWVASRFWIPNLDTFTLNSNHWLAGRWLEGPETWNPLARTDLAEGELVALPESWRSLETARRIFRERWCRREGLSMAVCGPPSSAARPPPPTLVEERAKWCKEISNIPENDPENDCQVKFDALDQRFAEDWKKERDAMLDNLPRVDLAGRDLRRVDAPGVSLVNANLIEARLEGADLRWARLEGADLVQTRLEGANLSQARLEGANLWRAHLEGALLTGARLEGANLSQARLERAWLTEARLEGASLMKARLEEASLSKARLEGANLSQARLEEADLRLAWLERAVLWQARLEGASLEGALLHGADLRGVQGLLQAQLEWATGDAHTLLPEGPAPDTGKPFFVWDCWEEEPSNFEQIVEWVNILASEERRRAIREAYLCGDRPREPTGTPLALDAPYPEGHPLAE